MAKKQISDLDVASKEELDENCSFIIDKSDRLTRKVSLGTLKSALCGASGNIVDMTITDGIKVLEASTSSAHNLYQLKYDSFIGCGVAQPAFGVWVSANEDGPWTQIGDHNLQGYLGCFAKGTWVKSEATGVVVLPLKQSGEGRSIVSGGIPLFDFSKVSTEQILEPNKWSDPIRIPFDCVINAWTNYSGAGSGINRPAYMLYASIDKENWIPVNGAVTEEASGFEYNVSVENTNSNRYYSAGTWIKIYPIHGDLHYKFIGLKSGSGSGSVSGSSSGGLIDIDKIETLQSIEFSYAETKDITLQYDSVIQIQLPSGHEDYELIKLWIKKNDLYLYLGNVNNSRFYTLRLKSGTTIRIINISAYQQTGLNAIINLLPIS